MKTMVQWQDKILETLAGKVDNYCLGGGTALSKVYFHHRQSLDLDFFTSSFNRKDILSLIKFLSGKVDKDFKIAGEQQKKDKVRILVFNTQLSQNAFLKIDFIEDYIRRLKPAKQIDGIWVFALEDIYLRKIYAITGTIESLDTVGRKISEGGRQEAKDFYDLYFLSHTFMNLSDFAFKYCDATMQEALIRWFRTYSRIEIKTGILELKTKNKIDYKEMEKHFKKEIDCLLERQIDRI
jgi:predicted nucleotidyltransferase component of viral defense system